MPPLHNPFDLTLSDIIMAKDHKRNKQSPTPSDDQLAAVRRLAGSGDLSQARQRLAALRKSFPDFKPLLVLAWEIEDRHNQPMIATARALEWQSASPNSQAAEKALCKSAEAAGLAAVYARALQRLSVLKGGEVIQLPEIIESEDESIPLAVLELIDLSIMHLADDKPATAIALLQNVNHPATRNNLAQAFFVSGDIVQAHAVAEANWQAHPQNLFALERTVRWRCWIEGMDRCLGFTATLTHSTPERIEDAIAQVAALRFLDDENGAQQAWQKSSKATFWQHADEEQRKLFYGLKNPQVGSLWSSSVWFPDTWIRAVRNFSTQSGGVGDDQPEQHWDGLLSTCSAHADYLVRAADMGNEITRMLALAVLKLRAKQGDAAALANLQAMLKRPNDSDTERTEIAKLLNDA